MAPLKPKSTKSRTKSGSKMTSQSFSKPRRKPVPPAKTDQVKTKRPQLGSLLSVPTRRTKRQYTAEELGVPALNGIVPASAAKPARGGGKKGKVFVADGTQTMAILRMVEAEKNADVESRLARARQLEEIREKKRELEEQRAKAKRGELERKMEEVRGKKRRRSKGGKGAEKDLENVVEANGRTKKKRVSFG